MSINKQLVTLHIYYIHVTLYVTLIDIMCRQISHLINFLCLHSVEHSIIISPAGEKLEEVGEGEEGGKEGRISFYFPPRCLKSKIFCRVLNICFQTASSH